MVDTRLSPQREFLKACYLDPTERPNKTLFGLIMVLTITLSAGIATGAGPELGAFAPLRRAEGRVAFRYAQPESRARVGPCTAAACAL